jgi:hypothetical protein
VLVHERDPQSWVLKALREAGNSLLAEFSALPERALIHRPAPDEWCLTEIAGHLRDAEELAVQQIQAALSGHRLPVRDLDSLPAERDYRSRPLSPVLSDFRGLRRETTGILWSLMGSDWETSGAHPYRGEVTVELLARELAQHDLEHLWQIRRLKSQLGLGAEG